MTFAKQAQSIEAKVWVDLRLGGHCAISGSRVAEKFADGWHGGCRAYAELPAARAPSNDRKSHDVLLFAYMGRRRHDNVPHRLIMNASQLVRRL
ncbi:hypothetical protein GCM10009304_36310 [Pseudomonas matsuisoli]|uniref:Uncharacterized protein n=1 Tax=Pseudomonas matsuisoli TaxID=1515666 RepID=A0A917V0X0_9PSED|nr:hypothetical protein GCM10009304_36310 [Pseudomonas matsuisoli]